MTPSVNFICGALILTSPLFPLSFFFFHLCALLLPKSSPRTCAAGGSAGVPPCTRHPDPRRPNLLRPAFHHYLPITDANGARDGNRRGCPHPFVSWGQSEPASEPNILLRVSLLMGRVEMGFMGWVLLWSSFGWVELGFSTTWVRAGWVNRK